MLVEQINGSEKSNQTKCESKLGLHNSRSDHCLVNGYKLQSPQAIASASKPCRSAGNDWQAVGSYFQATASD